MSVGDRKVAALCPLRPLPSRADGLVVPWARRSRNWHEHGRARGALSARGPLDRGWRQPSDCPV